MKKNIVYIISFFNFFIFNNLIAQDVDPVCLNLKDLQKEMSYPLEARKKNIYGKVIIRVLVGKDGKYIKHQVYRSPHKILDEMCTKNITSILFKPGSIDGKPIKCWVNVPFDFRFEEDNEQKIKADKLLKEENSRLALGIYLNLLNSEKKLSYYFKASECYYNMENFEKSMIYCDSAYKYSKTNEDLKSFYTLKFMILWKLEDFIRLKNDTQSAFSKFSDLYFLDQYFNACSSAVDFKDFCKDLEKNAELYPESKVYDMLGYGFMKNNNYTKAKIYLLKHLKLYPENASNYKDLAKISFYDKNIKEGCNYLKNAEKYNYDSEHDRDGDKLNDLKLEFCK